MGRRMKAWMAGLALTVVAALPAAESRDYWVFDVVGDSISAGVNPGCGTYGWGHMLFGQLACGQAATDETLTNLWPDVAAHNGAVSGSTARDWAWARPEYLQAVSNRHPDLVVVFIGGNDGLLYAADGVYTEAEREEFRTHLVAILQQLRANSPAPDVVVANYYDLFDGFSANLPDPFAAYRGLSSAVAVGNDIIADVASAQNCFLVDVHAAFLHHGYGAELGDAGHLAPDYVRTPLSAFDIHPVTAGHDAIRRAVFARLAELREIPKLLVPSGTAGQVVLRWSGSIGQNYVVQRAVGVTNAYADVATNAGAPPVNVCTDALPAATDVFYFYRVRVE